MTTLIILIAVIVLVLGGIGLFVRRGRTPSAGSRASKPRPTPASPPPKKPPVVEQDEEVLVPGDHPFADEESLAIGDENEKEDDLAGDAPVYRERLNRSRGLFATLRSLRGGSAFEESAYEELERALLSADVGVQTTDLLLSRVRQRVEVDQGDGTELIDVLRSEMIQLLDHDDSGAVINRELSTAVDGDHVPVWLFVGVNGVGKTTTIGKLATRESAKGKKLVLAAGDTFRAAAGDQLAVWAERAGADVVRGAEGGDPSAVVFDAIQRGGARNCDVVLADTAGRLHNKVNLIEELKKIRRVADKDPGQVTEVLLVLDATTGQNAVSQAREFLDAVEVTGVVLSKLDGTARGGVVVAIQEVLNLPVKLVGLGEGAADLVVFDPEAFVDALLAP